MPDESKTEIDDLADILDMLDEGKPKAVPTTPKTGQTDDNFDDVLEMMGRDKPQVPAPKPATPATDEDDQMDFMGVLGLEQKRTVPDITKPWMKHHEFVLVKTLAEVNKIVDDALACKHCSLDLECEGLDNRIFYDEQGKPFTKHKIVGYCLSVGDAKIGYYVPVRHTPSGGELSLNVEPVAEVEAAIRRLCKAAQPVLKPDTKDPLGGRDILTPPQVVIDFWHASFDQEFLYPITGIDFWHPDSFEDGSLACFVLFSADRHLGLKGKAEQKLHDSEGHAYEMIELKELFPVRGREIEFHTLSPDEPGVIKYACSDAICTRLLGDHKDILPVVKERYGFTYRLEKQVAQVKRVMERNRVKLDRARINELKATHETAIAAIREKIVALAVSKGFHQFEPGSPKQLGEFLFTERGLDISPKPDKTANGQFKTDWTTLEELTKELGDNAPPVFKWIIEYREEEKLLGTYLESMSANLDRNDEMRFQFKQTGAATGRFSAPAGDPAHGYSGIPIHGIPATSDLRTCFIARDGYTMLKCDYAGQELRIVTNLSNEPVWIKEFLQGDGDLHTITARAFFNKQDVSKDERKMGKCVHPDTLVYLDQRLTTMRSALNFSAEEGVFRETAGIIHDGTSWKRLSATFNGGTKPLVHVVTSGGILTSTENHQFEMRDGSFVRAGDLQPGNRLQPSILPEVPDREYQTLRVDLWEGLPPAQYKLTHDLAYFAGVFVGDGTGNASSAALTHGASGVIDPFGQDYEDWIQSLERSTHVCGFTTTRKDKAQLYLGSRVVVRFLRALGIQGKAQKSLRVPSWVLEAGKEAILHYLGGLFDTDGTVSKKTPAINWTTKSFVLAGQVATALRACGLDFNTELTFNTTYERYYARLRLTVESSWALRAYMRHSGKVARLRAPSYEGRKKDRFQVLRVLPSEEGPCVDVTVGESHRYLANGFVTHNTANFALIYGGGPQAIMRATGCDKIEGARRKQAFDKSVPTFAGWVKQQHGRVKKELGVWTAFARWIAIPDANLQPGGTDSNDRRADEAHSKMVRASCERQATNYPIQGCLNAKSVVLTDHGYFSIGDLHARGTSDLRVWTGVRWAPFTAHNMGSWQLADIVLKDGTTVQCDTRHKLLVVTADGYSWVEYADLRPEDCIATALCEQVKFPCDPLPSIVPQKGHRLTVTPTEDWDGFWYWMGRYYGDGNVDNTRHGVSYAFGDHEKEAIERCVKFWSFWGLNPQVRTATHQPDQKVSTRHRVELYSIDLTRWLAEFGIKQATAHTKRLPARIFQETLAYRKAFMMGFMDSDGCRPPVATAKGNPYNIHLCQRELLADTKLLLRTLGVESTLRGPYEYQNKQVMTTSYRLDIQRRMFERNVVGRTDLRHAKFHDMFAPKFLVANFLSKGTWARKDFPDESLYVMYLRLREGGKVSVYTLDRMCKTLNVTLDQPIYGFKRLVTRTERSEEEDTYTLSVSDPLHRFEADGVITKNSGADIMKIAMVLCHKELAKLGWLKAGGDDSVRMLLTVHDEIVFEIRHDRVIEALPILVEQMEAPTKMARPPYSPHWGVPLITEPLVGPTWGTGYPCERYKDGHKMKESEVVAGGFVYGTLRTVDMNKDGTPKDHPVAGESIHKSDTEKKKVTIRVDKPMWLENVGTVSEPMPAPKGEGGPPKEGGGSSAPPTSPASGSPPPAPQAPPTLSEVVGTKNGVVKTATLRLKNLSTGSVKQVRMICARFLDPDHGDVIQIIDPASNQVLVDPKFGIRVETAKLADAMLELNLSDGKVHYST